MLFKHSKFLHVSFVAEFEGSEVNSLSFCLGFLFVLYIYFYSFPRQLFQILIWEEERKSPPLSIKSPFDTKHSHLYFFFYFHLYYLRIPVTFDETDGFTSGGYLSL